MLKRSLFVLAVAAFMIPVANAGTLKTDSWDMVCTAAPQQVCTLNVTMQVPWWVRIHPESDIPIVQVQGTLDPDKGTANFAGCIDTTVTANFSGVLSATIVPTTDGACLGGTWKVTITPSTFVKCDTGIKICAEVDGAYLHCLQACHKYTVAIVTIKAAPTGLTCTCACP